MSGDVNWGIETDPDTILALALDRVSAGESLGSILSSAGADAEWLEPLLVAAITIRRMRGAVPVPSGEASLAGFLARARRVAPKSVAKSVLRPWWTRLSDGLRLPAGFAPRLASVAMSILLVAFALISGLTLFLGSPSAVAAQNVLPGQIVYPLKRLGEDILLSLPQSSQSRSAKVAEYEERRQREVRALLDRRLEARVTFRGVVEALSGEGAVVNGIALNITDEARVEGRLAVGAWVRVEASTQDDGTLRVHVLVVERPRPAQVPTPEPTVQPTATHTVTLEPTVTATPQPSPTQSSTEPAPTEEVEVDTPERTEATPGGEPTEAPTPSATATRTPRPGATPTRLPTEGTPEHPEGGENLNGNGNDNTNDDDGNANDDDDNDNDNDGNDNDEADGHSDDGDNGDDRDSGDEHSASGGDGETDGDSSTMTDIAGDRSDISLLGQDDRAGTAL